MQKVFKLLLGRALRSSLCLTDSFGCFHAKLFLLKFYFIRDCVIIMLLVLPYTYVCYVVLMYQLIYHTVQLL